MCYCHHSKAQLNFAVSSYDRLQLGVIFQFHFQGFRNHKLHDVLSAPGTADLTADVDFSYLRKMAQGKTATLGPIKQREFLKNMGIDLRLQVQECS